MRAFALIAPLVLLVACDSSVEPFIGGAPPYTLWGMFNSGADTQYVRVFSIEARSGLDREGDIDATVRSTDLTTGEERTWEHREVQFSETEFGHVFWSDFRPESGHRYQLTVTRSDGATSTARVTVPLSVIVTVDRQTNSANVPILIQAQEDLNIVGAEVVYEATNVPPVNLWPPDRSLKHGTVFHAVTVPYADRIQKAGAGWQIQVNLQQDFGIVESEYRRNCLITDGNPHIALQRVEFRFVAADSSWVPPQGTFDPEVLVEPGAFSNVENGYGFVGAGEVVQVRWIPSAEVRQLVGYSHEELCRIRVGDFPECTDPPIPCMGENPLSLWEVFF